MALNRQTNGRLILWFRDDKHNLIAISIMMEENAAILYTLLYKLYNNYYTYHTRSRTCRILQFQTHNKIGNSSV